MAGAFVKDGTHCLQVTAVVAAHKDNATTITIQVATSPGLGTITMTFPDAAKAAAFWGTLQTALV